MMSNTQSRSELVHGSGIQYFKCSYNLFTRRIMNNNINKSIIGNTEKGKTHYENFRVTISQTFHNISIWSIIGMLQQHDLR